LFSAPLPARAADDDDLTAGAGRLVTVRGRLVEVRPKDNELVVNVRRGEDVRLTVDKRSRVQLNGEDAKLDRFKEGMRVRVSYIPREGKNRVVALSEPRITLEKVQKGINQALEVAKARSFQQKEEYRRDMEAVLADLDDRIDELQERAKRAGAEAKKRYAADLDELRRKREAARDKLERVKAATPDVWDDVKTGVNSAFDDLRRALDRARTRIDEPPPRERERERDR
jgi:hypothetical protein